MDTFYLILICAGVLGLAVVIVGLLKRKPGDKPWKWILGGAGAILSVVLGAVFLYRRSRKKDEEKSSFDPPERKRPHEGEVKRIDHEGDKIDEESEELKDQEDKLDEEKEKTDEDKKDLDERAKETDKLLEEALDSPPPDEPDNKPDPELSDYLRNRGG